MPFASAEFIHEYVKAYPSVAAHGHPLWSFWPNMATTAALAVALGVTLASQARLAPVVQGASLGALAAHVGVGAVMLMAVLGTLFVTVRAGRRAIVGLIFLFPLSRAQ